MDDERQGSFFEWFADEGPDLGDIIRDDLFPEALRYYYIEVEDDETDDINAEFDLDDTDDEEDGDEDEDDEPPQKKGKWQ
ncbi:hypothetical protein BC938DRAFT_478896 [Jimgerdemannia flammicorona]|uniref:Uncharacterized protein n=1 Tax=Jimgerdemannia flammicorona TaxID=994334 RepID=A0A433P4L9_9FUNG|nr:hypothetical protein BC938DRAFT_478896 [Jimgerdemannia flammicorona]